MKIPNKKELQQTAVNHSSDIDFKDFMNLCKKCTTSPYFFLVIQSYSSIKYSFTIEKEYFRKNIKTNHENLGLSFSAREKFSNKKFDKLDKIR